jgi:lipoprotein signal peptidase
VAYNFADVCITVAQALFFVAMVLWGARRIESSRRKEATA